jgi:hypothetical protein
MTSDRKKPGLAFCATVVVVAVLVGYPLSFGPACWITSYAEERWGSCYEKHGGRLVDVIYQPMVQIAWDNNGWFHNRHLIDDYAELLAQRGWRWGSSSHGPDEPFHQFYWSAPLPSMRGAHDELRFKPGDPLTTDAMREYRRRQNEDLPHDVPEPTIP